MNDCLIVFAKEPEIGRGKVRLSDELSQDQCLALYKAFLKDTLRLAETLECNIKMLAYDITAGAPGYLKRIDGNFILYRQEGNDLGQRMHNAFKFSSKVNSRQTVIIGSDSPNLPADYLKEAFWRLDTFDIVLGPCYDGGYYLVGLNTSCLEIFQDVKWSSESVFENTVENAVSLGKKIAILPEWYDIDDLDGLERLKQDLKKDNNTAVWTRKFLKI